MLRKISLMLVVLFWAFSLNAQTTQGTYFADTFGTLKRDLQLTDGQIAKIKPLLEQETGELEELACNPVTSRTYKINAFDKVLRSSNEKMKPFLTASQSDRLLGIRTIQMQQVRASHFAGTNPPNCCSTWRPHL